MAVSGVLQAAAPAAGLAFRLVALDARPMHHDEAKFGALVERGEYPSGSCRLSSAPG